MSYFASSKYLEKYGRYGKTFHTKVIRFKIIKFEGRHKRIDIY